MTLPAFDGSEYRRTVLTPLRSAAPSAVDDVFWLGHVPRDVDDVAVIGARLKETKAFLHKERARPRQADVAAAVLKEWSRVEGVLTDGGARRSLRIRLGADTPGGAVAVAAGPAARGGSSGATGDPAARRRGQVAQALGELARLREDPELAEDLFAFLGLPFTATADMLRARLDKIADINRMRRADRERSLVDELLMHARELLVEGDPAAYRAGLVADASPADPVPSPTAVPAASPAVPPAAPVDSRPAEPAAPVAPPPAQGAARPSPPKIDMGRRPRRPGPPANAPSHEPAEPTPLIAPTVTAVESRREPDGTVVVTWVWPHGVTEAFVAVGASATPESPGPGGRKITNMKYDLDGGARLASIAPGTALSVHTGRRDQAGQLRWNAPEHARETIAG